MVTTLIPQSPGIQKVLENNTMLESLRQRNNLAIALSQVNGLLDPEQNEAVIQQVNQILKNNGYPYLARDLDKEAAKLLESMEETAQDETTQEDN